MIAWNRVNPAWTELVRISAKLFYAYRFGVITSCFGFVVHLYLLRVVWETVYAGRSSVEGVSSDVLLVYLSISALHRYFMPNVIAYNIQTRVTSGTVANDLVRPLGFMKQMVALHTGATISLLPMLVVFIPVAMLVGSLTLPSPGDMAVYLFSLLLAFVVTMLIWMHIGLLAFWIFHVNGIRAMLGISSELLAGALVPLWFMPDGMRRVLEFLPFQAMTLLPASIFSGQVTGVDTIRPLAIQLAWIGLLVLTSQVMWSRAQAKLVIQGG